VNSKAIDFVQKECSTYFTGARVEPLMPLKNSVLMVTGGTGFVGTWLAEMVSFLNETASFNCQLILVARDLERFKKKCPHLASNRNITLIKADVRFALDLPRECNWIVHGAAVPDHHTSLSYPIETMTTIAQGTEAVLRFSERCSDLKMLLNLSSGWVYGDQPVEVEKIPESYSGGPSLNTINSIYPEAKRYSEVLAASFRHQLKVPVTTVRPFAFLGPYQRLSSPWAANNFIFDALSGNKIRILGNGETVRSYMYATDMAYWLLNMLVRSNSGACYNLGSPEPIALGELARMVSSLVSTPTEVSFSSGADMQKASRKSKLVPDTALAEKDFALKHTVSLRESLSKTIDWYKVSQEV